MLRRSWSIFAQHGIDSRSIGAQAELPARILQVAAARPAHSSRSHREYRVAQGMEGAAQVAGRAGGGGDAGARRDGGVASAGAGHGAARSRHSGAALRRRAARLRGDRAFHQRSGARPGPRAGARQGRQGADCAAGLLRSFRLWRSICARGGRIWSASARRAGGRAAARSNVRQDDARCRPDAVCFSRCAACR